MNKRIIYQKTSTCAPQNALRRKFWATLLLLSLAIIVALLLLPPAKQMLSALLTGLMPIYIGAFIVYLLKEPRKWLANKVFKPLFKGAKNPQRARMTLALLVVFLLFIALLVGIFMLFIPKFLSIIENIISNADAYTEKIKTELVSFLSNIPYFDKINIDSFIDNALNDLVNSLKELAPQLAQLLAGFASDLLEFIGMLVIAMFFSFLFLLNIDKYKRAISGYAKKRLRPTKYRKFANFVRNSDRILIDYGFSKLIEGIIIFGSVCVGLLACGAPMTIELALLMAILNVIPYIGPIIALVPIILFSLVLASANVALISAIVSISIVIIVTSFITPMIVGQKIKIDTLTVILSLTIGGALFGTLGLILAPPIAAIIMKPFFSPSAQSGKPAYFSKTTNFDKPANFKNTNFNKGTRLNKKG